MATRSLAYTTCALCPSKDKCQEIWEELPLESQVGIFSGLNSKQRKRIELTKNSDKPITKQIILDQHVKTFLNPRTQQHIKSLGEEDPIVKQANEWLLWEFVKIEERKPQSDRGIQLRFLI